MRAMSSPSIWLDYRPIRIGWVVGDPNIATLVTAAQFSSCVWGGRFNPIIPAHDPEQADKLISRFGVDALHALDESEAAKALIHKHSKYLIPDFPDGVFHAKEKFCQYADIYHPAKKYLQEKPRDLSLAEIRWSENDPLKDLFSMTFGNYPEGSVTGIDYSVIFKELSPEVFTIGENQPIPVSIKDYISPLKFSALYLKLSGRSSSWLNPGIFLGDVGNINDLLNFWNFRAAGAGLLFYDQRRHERLAPLVDAYAASIRERTEARDREFCVWSHDTEESIENLNLEGLRILRCAIDHTWNGLNIRPIRVNFNRDYHEVVSNFSENGRRKISTFSLPELPFHKALSRSHMQKFAISIRSFSRGMTDDFTFQTPFIPSLNEFYGRNYAESYSEARSERNQFDEATLGVITSVSAQRKSISAIDVQKFWKEIFALVNLEYARNEPGHRCANLIRQLGGLQGCRVLKIPGLRKLIHKYSQDQSFTQSAQQIIRDTDEMTGISTFSSHEDLYIEYRPGRGKLKPLEVFTYMVKQGLFRVGLEIKCTECFLESWVHIDEVKTICKCDYCGNEFNVTPFLRDRDWRYRRSGIIGLPRDKLDSIVVALTLQQLDTCFQEAIMYSTSANLVSKNSKVETCEVDFLLLLHGRAHNGDTPIQFLLGECKSEGGVIDDEDIRKMKKLATELESEIGQAYVLFSKTGRFSNEEIERIKTINDEHCLRAIIFSPDQLEPYYVYERAEEGVIPHRYGVSLSDLAQNTKALFFPT